MNANETTDDVLARVLAMVQFEVEHAMMRYPKFNSAHEGYAVLLEEVDELKDEVWKSPKKRDYKAMGDEARQVAAMAVRLILDCVYPELVK